MDSFELIDEALFDKMCEPGADIDALIVPHNYCEKCHVPMVVSGLEYQCTECGATMQNELDGYKDHGETGTCSIRITAGSNKGRFYHINGDYARTQKQAVLQQLLRHQAHYAGPAFPQNVLQAAAEHYNRIQKYVTEDDVDELGQILGQKKFVRRGNIKDEVLAGLIYFEGIRVGIVRKKKDIAAFMCLVSNGFAQGEDILRTLEAEGKIDLPINEAEEPLEGFIDRYLETLSIDNARYAPFIVDLVIDSERRQIGMSSQISSKIVGALWMVITQCKLNITARVLEIAADNTKKNTFIKFYNVVCEKIRLFAHIFLRHNIPLPAVPRKAGSKK